MTPRGSLSSAWIAWSLVQFAVGGAAVAPPLWALSGLTQAAEFEVRPSGDLFSYTAGCARVDGDVLGMIVRARAGASWAYRMVTVDVDGTRLADVEIPGTGEGQQAFPRSCAVTQEGIAMMVLNPAGLELATWTLAGVLLARADVAVDRFDVQGLLPFQDGDLLLWGNSGFGTQVVRVGVDGTVRWISEPVGGPQTAVLGLGVGPDGTIAVTGVKGVGDSMCDAWAAVLGPDGAVRDQYAGLGEVCGIAGGEELLLVCWAEETGLRAIGADGEARSLLRTEEARWGPMEAIRTCGRLVVVPKFQAGIARAWVFDARGELLEAVTRTADSLMGVIDLLPFDDGFWLTATVFRVKEDPPGQDFSIRAIRWQCSDYPSGEPVSERPAFGTTAPSAQPDSRPPQRR